MKRKYPKLKQCRTVGQLIGELKRLNWKKALRYTQCCCLATMVIGTGVNDIHLGLSLIAAGGITYWIADAVK